ncbi:MAG: YicC family protein [Clostridia bacterium]|nr:YicC family protein [Clostridia bacterium]
MIKSMTGFGRAQASVDGFNITAEIKSVNHRYFEFSSRIPRAYAFLEEKIKSYLSSYIARGKVECFLTIEATADDSVTVKVNEPLAKGYYDAIHFIGDNFSVNANISAQDIARYPEVLSVTKNAVDEDDLWEKVKGVLEEAVLRFIKMREQEGGKLKADVLSRADTIIENVAFVEKRSPETVKEYNEKLLTRMKEVLEGVQVDESRILTEAAIYADKIAVAEETVRLRSHIDQLRSMMNSDEAIGRKLDFLVQEINRETNTIGSKAQDVEIARIVIDTKAEIEKIREQIQNIE